ncbi:MAG: chalcone isomerase family protein [Pseudomonadota bacterium]
MLAALLLALSLSVPTHIGEQLAQARLAGTGSYTWFGLTLYDAELWVGEPGYQAGAPFVLELRYARALEGRRIADASVDQMEKMGAGTPAQRAAWRIRLRAMFPDVKKGSRIAGASLPDGGVRFFLDGAPLASVPDPAFGKAFFGIWLDPATSAPGLRAALLKDGAPR